jgi:succinate dehydrogenase / fumarate reductase, cytochrome b subunit
MTRVLAFLNSSIGRKVVMAVTGAFLLLFVLGHMAGNLQIYLGPEALDRYAVFLREFGHGGGIWVARAVILAAVLGHLWGALMTTLESWRARPVGYKGWRSAGDASTLSSRTMRWTGVVILVFVLYHLAHLTLGAHFANPGFRDGQVFHNVVVGFRQMGSSAFYIVAMIALGLHMYHGGWSLFQTLGISHPRYNRLRLGFAAVVAVVVVLVNVSFPISVLMEIVKEAPQAAAAWLGR